VTSVHVVDYNCVTCFGPGYEALWNSLMNNRCGAYQVNRFSSKNYVNQQAACICQLDSMPFGKRFPALLELLCQNNIQIPADTMLITATTKDNIELLDSPDSLLTESMATLLQRQWNLNQPGHNINTACTSSSTAVLWASELITAGLTDSVIICSADIISEFVFSGFSALRAMSPGRCKPFDKNRDGLILGEAAAYIILMSEYRMKRQRRQSRGIIRGWGTSSDATHITAPDRFGRGLQRAINKAFKRADIQISQLSSINTHGTGTIHNDAMEITAFGQIFGNNIPPLYSIKGAVGHSLGSCGLIEMIVALLSFEKKLIPPTTGLIDPEPAVASALSTQAQTVCGNFTMSVNSGFGGSNTALILEYH
jgi:3-oxoacyl-(acyl-carrier-protein) synthase